MKLTQVSVAVLMILIFGSIPGLAQTDRTFTGNQNNNWHNALNWDPPDNYPQAADKAIIPNGKTCRIQSVDDAAEIVQVDVGGTLVIDGQTLTIDTNGDGTHDTPKLTVNGDLKFEGTDATLVYGNTGLVAPIYFVLDGAGTVLTDGLPGILTAGG